METVSSAQNANDGDEFVPQHIDSDSSTEVESNHHSDTVTYKKRRLRLHNVRATGPSRLFNPTNVSIHFRQSNDQSTGEDTQSELAIRWQSRDNRKGRRPTAKLLTKIKSPVTSTKVKAWLINTLKGCWRMISVFPYWDLAWYSGWSYTIGSILFVMDGLWAWLPLAFPATEFPGEEKYGTGLLFFFGALLYELGATTAYLEAINDGSFQGSAMKRFLEGHEADSKKMFDEKLHAFFGHLVPHHRSKDEEDQQNVDTECGWLTREQSGRPGSIYPSGKRPAPRRGGVDFGTPEEGAMRECHTFRWYPTWRAFRHHHIFEIGFIACVIQLFGATLYAIAGVVALPGVLSSLAAWQELGAYWVPQIVASCCFLTAGILFTIETHESWYLPELKLIGWWIGAWATVGSVGFL